MNLSQTTKYVSIGTFFLIVLTSFVFADLDDGLIAYYTLDSTAEDEINDNNMLLAGSEYASGKLNNGLYCDGNDDPKIPSSSV